MSLFSIYFAMDMCYNMGEVMKMEWKRFWQRYRWTLLMMLVTAIGITVTGILFEQAAIRMLPLYVSLIISLMHTRAIRYAHLLGSMNVILYGFVNLHYGIFGAAMSCFFFSCPLQFVTFLRWHKNREGSSTKFRKLTPVWRACLALGFAVLWVGTVLVLRALGSSYRLWDSTTTLLDLTVTALTLLAFVESAPLRAFACLLGVGLAITVFLDSPDYAPYLIYNVYALICVTMGMFATMSIYKQQRAAERGADEEGEV